MSTHDDQLVGAPFASLQVRSLAALAVDIMVFGHELTHQRQGAIQKLTTYADNKDAQEFSAAHPCGEAPTAREEE